MKPGRLTSRVATAVLTLVVSHAATGQAARPAPWIVEDLGKGRGVIDGHRGPLPWSNQTMAKLVERWGTPARVRVPYRSECVAVWRSPRVTVHLANWGYVPNAENVCSPRWGLVQALQTAGPNWRTRRGLRVGDPVRTVRRLYPNAVLGSYHGAGKAWLLRPRRTACVGDCGGATTTLSSGVHAVVRAGRVAQFHVFVGGAGE